MKRIIINIIKLKNLKTITITEYLNRKGIPFKEANGELITKCLFCGKDKHLYFSAETGQYDCKLCGKQGNIITLARHFGDNIKEIFLNNNHNQNNMNGQNKTKTPFDTSLVDKYHNQLPESIRKYLNKRGISNEIIESKKLGWGSFYGKYWITIPIKDFSGEYSFFKLRTNPFKEEGGEKYMVYPTGNSTTLYGFENLKENKKIFLCEGEFDQMILESRGIATVSSTGGAGTFKENWLENFQDCQEIYICLDIDEAGKNGAEKIAQKLSSAIKAQIFTTSLPEELGKGGDITDYFSKGYKKEDLISKYSKLYEPSSQNNVDNKEEKREMPPTMQLIRILENAGMSCFLDQYNTPCFTVDGFGNTVGNLYSNKCDVWIYNTMYEQEKFFGKETVNNAKRVLEAQAYKNNKHYNLSVRIANDEEGNIWYQLGSKAIKINSEGWEIVDKYPILFRKFSHQVEQVIPVKGKSLESIFDIINVKNENYKILLQVYIISCFIPDLAHPILVLFGNHGSAKSTTNKLIKSLIDPSSISILEPTNNSDQFTQIVSHHQVAYFDNFSGLSNDLSDKMCRACTGSGSSKRVLYSDDDDYIYNFRHSIGINGISNVVSKPDLLDRSLLIEMMEISKDKRKTENEINELFLKIKAEILGYCLSSVSKAMEIRPSIHLNNVPRMADFTYWGCAIAEAIGIGKDRFLEAYMQNIEKQNVEAIDASPIGSSIIELINQEDTGILKLTPVKMLEKLNMVAAENLHLDTTHDRYWPKNEKILGRRIREIAPNLKVKGIEIENGRESERFIIIKDIEKYKEHQKELKECEDIAKTLF